MKQAEAEMLDFEMKFYEKLVRGKPTYVDALLALAECYTRKKLYLKGLEIDRRLAKIFPKDAVVHYNLACSYALVGQKQNAMKKLEMSVKLGYQDFEHMKHDGDLKSLHQDPRFLKLISEPATSKT